MSLSIYTASRKPEALGVRDQHCTRALDNQRRPAVPSRSHLNGKQEEAEEGRL